MDPELKIPDERLAQLDRHFDAIQAIILARQHPVTGLLPASTAVTVHGDYTDAWVRDNVYSIYAVWGLALALSTTCTRSSADARTGTRRCPVDAGSAHFNDESGWKS